VTEKTQKVVPEKRKKGGKTGHIAMNEDRVVHRVGLSQKKKRGGKERKLRW